MAGEFVLICIAIVIMKMTVDDIRQHFFSDPVVPDRIFSVELLPYLTVSAL